MGRRLQNDGLDFLRILCLIFLLVEVKVFQNVGYISLNSISLTFYQIEAVSSRTISILQIRQPRARESEVMEASFDRTHFALSQLVSRGILIQKGNQTN